LLTQSSDQRVLMSSVYRKSVFSAEESDPSICQNMMDVG